MKLNIGCGAHYAEGFTNIDTYSGGEVTPDIVMSATDLLFEDNSCSFVYLGHVLEHIPEDQVITALNEAWRVLRPGGTLCIVGPDYQAAVQAEDEESIQGIEEGGQAWPGDEHHWVCDRNTLLKFIRRSVIPEMKVATLDEVEEAGAPLTSKAYWQVAFLGEKPNP